MNSDTFTGAIAGPVLTVSELKMGKTIKIGDILSGADVAENTVITAQLTGDTGKEGSYELSRSQSVAAEPMNSGDPAHTKHFKLVAHEAHWHAYCDGTTHIDVIDPANAHSGFSHRVRTYPCDCKHSTDAPAWNNTKTYTLGARVSLAGRIFTAARGNTNVSPTSGASSVDWTLVNSPAAPIGPSPPATQTVPVGTYVTPPVITAAAPKPALQPAPPFTTAP
jgi:hypothetical protein